MVKGNTIFKGYYNKPKETAEVLKDGWYLTGDEGSIVAETLLDLLKIDAKINETKRDYTSRFMEAAINLLGLKEVLS